MIESLDASARIAYGCLYELGPRCFRVIAAFVGAIVARCRKQVEVRCRAYASESEPQVVAEVEDAVLFWAILGPW